jgi:hypothetical protein
VYANSTTGVVKKNQMPLTGFEPITVGLQNHCSTVELKGQKQNNNFQRAGLEPTMLMSKTRALPFWLPLKKMQSRGLEPLTGKPNRFTI